ncbi:hypothetical protein ACI78Q_22550 [Geodermatophilus sp. SYSU D00705]
MFRKKTHGQIIGEELQEGFSHIGTAVAEAGRAAAEQLAPRVEAAREATGPALEAAKVAVAPKVAAAVAVAAPAVASARDALSPRVEAAREALGPRVEAAREAAAPRVASALTAAQLAASRAASDLGPRMEAAREAAHKALEHDVVPRLTAAQAATLAYAAPKVLAAREAVSPVLESTRESIAAGLHTALEELDVRREELTATTAKAKKQAAKRRRALEKKAARTSRQVKRKIGVEPAPRRWPWLLAVLVVGAAAFAALRRRKDDDLWTPAPTGDGPVPSYREDPVPSSPSNSGKTVSTAQDTPGDASPEESDMGMRDAQLVEGDGPDLPTAPEDTRPEPYTSGGNAPDPSPTAGPRDQQP